MTRRHRLRNAIAPTRGLVKGVLLSLLGIVSVVIGALMAFNTQIQGSIRVLNDMMSSIIEATLGPDATDAVIHWTGATLFLLGIALIVFAIRGVFIHVVETLDPDLKAGRVDLFLQRQQLAQGPRIVTLGGGTGLSTLLRGWKKHSSNITAIVTVTDDGGSSGRLIQEKGMIPPGDIRNCLVALADAEKAMTDLFQHRFMDSGALSGHSLGNLLIAALVDLAHGDFEKAINYASKVLAIRGQVMPSTLDHVGLRALLDDGVEISGETAIVEAGRKIRELKLAPENVHPYQPALDAIADADLICIGPGSVYTSVIPNLLIPGVAEALKSSKAIKVYICNVMTQKGESDTFSASEHVGAIMQQVRERVFDYVLVNTGVPSDASLEKYRAFGQIFVDPDIDRIKAMGLRVIPGNFMSDTDYVRHDPVKVVSKLMTILGL
ncbi:MAG: uridine diphosphate-N-acetylglucosamine-binding protein YvcK [Armatimonadetes bacterium]|nr:uridine diphosphate-N-acetylglucosamine-binding protein YvcK [Armatimonadota bacterium]MBS1727061.1 YvcK family protein [Armatimonadota bacterium]